LEKPSLRQRDKKLVKVSPTKYTWRSSLVAYLGKRCLMYVIQLLTSSTGDNTGIQEASNLNRISRAQLNPTEHHSR